MADITALFKATVKTVKSRNKALLGPNGVDKSILQNQRKRTDFSVKLKTVVDSITGLKDYLLQHRKDYVDVSRHTSESSMTDSERDQIDQHAEKVIRMCQEAIKQLRNEATGNKVLPQVKEFRIEAFTLIEKYLKGVCQIYSEQKAVRVKKVVDRKRISRLEPEAKRHKGLLDSKVKADNQSAETGTSEKDKTTTDENSKKGNDNGNNVADLDVANAANTAGEDDEISAEEAQMFADENQQLFEEMNSLVDEVRQIEGKVVEISKLQEVFAEKVLDQERDIGRIADTVVGTSENIKDANEDIREAMKNNAGLRVWILFFLIVCTFSLLFLDWYNP